MPFVRLGPAPASDFRSGERLQNLQSFSQTLERRTDLKWSFQRVGLVRQPALLLHLQSARQAAKFKGNEDSVVELEAHLSIGFAWIAL